jgi:hypothetical protein
MTKPTKEATMTDLEFLIAIKSYIEETQEAIDAEWGSCRNFVSLISAGMMPQPIYSEVISRIESLTFLTLH